jgi:hypothetical protein
MTAKELGRLTVAVTLVKEAAGHGLMESAGTQILKLLRHLGGSKLYSTAAMPKSVTGALSTSSRLAEELAKAESLGAPTQAIEEAKKRLTRARALADTARARHRANIGIVGTGLGLGTASSMLSPSAPSSSPYPYAYPPGYMPR